MTAVSTVLASAPFTVTESNTAGEWKATFDYVDGSGLKAQKTFADRRGKAACDQRDARSRAYAGVAGHAPLGPALGRAHGQVAHLQPPAQPVFYTGQGHARDAGQDLRATCTTASLLRGVTITTLTASSRRIGAAAACGRECDAADHPEGAHYADYRRASVLTPRTSSPPDFDVLASATAISSARSTSACSRGSSWLLRSLACGTTSEITAGRSSSCGPLNPRYPLRQERRLMRKMGVQPEMKAIQIATRT